MKTSIRYKCSCMQDEVAIDVDDRQPSEDIVHWMKRVVEPAFTDDHRKRSPLCRATALDYLKIPVPEDGRRIGDSPGRLN